MVLVVVVVVAKKNDARRGYLIMFTQALMTVRHEWCMCRVIVHGMSFDDMAWSV